MRAALLSFRGDWPFRGPLGAFVLLVMRRGLLRGGADDSDDVDFSGSWNPSLLRRPASAAMVETMAALENLRKVFSETVPGQQASPQGALVHPASVIGSGGLLSPVRRRRSSRGRGSNANGRNTSSPNLGPHASKLPPPSPPPPPPPPPQQPQHQPSSSPSSTYYGTSTR